MLYSVLDVKPVRFRHGVGVQSLITVVCCMDRWNLGSGDTVAWDVGFNREETAAYGLRQDLREQF